MLHNSNIKLSIAMIVMLGMGACKEHTNQMEHEKPNIIFIFTDDWGFGDLGCYGHSELKTPNIDRLAAEGTLFTQFHVTSGVCSPSRTSIITGHFPARHRVHGHFAASELNKKRDMPNWLNDTLAGHLPQLMQEAGYLTAHYGKWHLGGGGLPNGDPAAPNPAEYGYHDARVWNGNGPTWKGDQLWPETRYMDDDTVWVQNSNKLAVDATIDFLEKNRKKNSPIFVNLWLKDPHTPLWPSEEQKESWMHIDEPEQTYYSVLSDADHHIGRLLTMLDETGLTENTIVIFSSDNGPEWPNENPNAQTYWCRGSTDGLRGQKRSIFQGGVVVPFIVRWPGNTPEGSRDSSSVLSSIDLYPTFCEIASAEIPEGWNPEGEVIVDAWKGKTFERTKPLFWEWRFANPNHPDLWPEMAVRHGDWKLLRSFNHEKAALYNLADDPYEENNLFNEYPEIVSYLDKLWHEWKINLQ
jgi:arylsulfatase A-like enzyme